MTTPKAILGGLTKVSRGKSDVTSSGICRDACAQLCRLFSVVVVVVFVVLEIPRPIISVYCISKDDRTSK